MEKSDSNVRYPDELWVYSEVQNGEIVRPSLELVSEAKRLAKHSGSMVVCAVLGSEETITTEEVRKLGGYGADKVHVFLSSNLKMYSTDGYAKVLCDAITQYNPGIVLFSATSEGRDLAPRCAARLHTGLTADCTRLDTDLKEYSQYLTANSSLSVSEEEIQQDNHMLRMTRPAFGAHLMATIVCPQYRPCMSTVRPGVFRCNDYDINGAENCDVEIHYPDLEEAMIRTQVVETINSMTKKVDFSQAEVIVTVGRGIYTDTSRGITLASDLAELLGGMVGGSRAAVDNGWLPADRQIGQTGKTVRPKLYIAAGVSGAMQHAVGMKDSECILAINKDSKAPIFELADYGIVGNLFTVLPILIEEIKTRRGNA